MAKKTVEERLAELEEKKRQIEEQQKTLRARAKDQERKLRTRRLIQIGAIMDILGIRTVEEADNLKESCIASEDLWRSILDGAAAPVPEDSLAWKAMQARNQK